MFKIEYRTRQGQLVTQLMTTTEMEAKVKELEALEARTVKVAPTDSGSMRHNANQFLATLKAEIMTMKNLEILKAEMNKTYADYDKSVNASWVDYTIADEITTATAYDDAVARYNDAYDATK